MTKKNNEIELLMKQQCIKVTPARTYLLDILSQAKMPLSADEILQKLTVSKKEAFDRATLFRNLKTLAQHHLLEAIDLGEGFVRYSLHHHEHHAHHIMCKKCKKIEEVDFCITKEIEAFLKKKGYSQIEHRMDFSGVCKKCS